MFKNYEELINFAKSQERVKGNNQPYWETHHILPKSMGGKDTLDNLVLLSVAEHVEAHYLLALKYEITNRQWYYANLNAAWMVCHGKSKFTARKREEVEKWHDVRKICCGNHGFIFGLTNNGKVLLPQDYPYVDIKDNPVKEINDVVADIAANFDHFIALTASGRIIYLSESYGVDYDDEQD